MNKSELRKAVAETLHEIKYDNKCHCDYHCYCSNNPIEEEVMEKIEKYFIILLKKLGGNPDKVSDDYGWVYKEEETK